MSWARLFIIFLVLVLVFIGFDRGLYLLKRGYIIRVFDQPVIVLGLAREIPKEKRTPYPLYLQKSFRQRTEAGIGFREPLFEKNGLSRFWREAAC